ncbi:lysophospholipid acyltransferase family protein [Tessaracoccus sp. Z1128]
MSRQLSSWAQSRRGHRGPRLTWPRDIAQIASDLLRPGTPAGAPARTQASRDRLSLRARLSGRHLMLRMLSLRLDVELVSGDSIAGLQPPVVFAANEQGALDYQLLRLALPSRVRPTMIAPSRAIARGHNVVVFADEPVGRRLVGEFSTVPADLANQHNVPIVPVGIVGTFKLKDILKLALRSRPKVSIRFGAPIYTRGRSLVEASAELQARVEELVHEGELSWWTVQRRHGGGTGERPTPTAPRWRRLWDQAAPASAPESRIWR